jgi:hypothetical protein
MSDHRSFQGLPALVHAWSRPLVRAWSRRRWIAALVLVAPLVALYASVGPSLRVWWVLPTAVVNAALAAVLLASYVPLPGSGRWLDAGCSPCAAISGVAVLGSLVMRSTAPLEPGIALVAVLLVAFGLAQRLGKVSTCPAPAPR